MAFKTISTILCDFETDKHYLEDAVGVALREKAHLDVTCLGLDKTQPGFYYAGANAMILHDNLQQARDNSLELERQVCEVLQPTQMLWSTENATAQMVGLTTQVAQISRFSDLVVLPRPYGAGRGHEYEEILEAALFEGKVPVLVMPEGDAPTNPERVIIAWNESPESMRAIRAALPILQAAKTVDVTVIDPPQHSPSRSDPGGALCQMLSRHGVRAEVSVLAKTLPSVANVLCRHIQDKGADLLVMGAYGHSRFREALLGGATRQMLEIAPIPVFMAH